MDEFGKCLSYPSLLWDFRQFLFNLQFFSLLFLWYWDFFVVDGLVILECHLHHLTDYSWNPISSVQWFFAKLYCVLHFRSLQHITNFMNAFKYTYFCWTEITAVVLISQCVSLIPCWSAFPVHAWAFLLGGQLRQFISGVHLLWK